MKKIYLVLLCLVYGSYCFAQEGTLDPTYVPQSPFTITHAMTRDASGNIFVAGSNTDAGITMDIVKIKPDGTIDNTFSVTYFDNFMYPFLISVKTLCLQSDGKLLVGGQLRDQVYYELAAIRLNTNGTLDTSFNVSLPENFTASDIEIQPVTNKILIGGQGGVNTSAVFYRLLTTGATDTTFNTGGTGLSGGVEDILTLPNGDMYICGEFDAYNNIPRKNIAKINANGSLNTLTYTPINCWLRKMALQSDGKIVAVGQFYDTAYPALSTIIRFNSNGTPDSSFIPPAPPTGATYEFYDVKLQTDGKIIIGGEFSTIGGISRVGLARLHYSGSLDTCFNPGLGTTTAVNSGNGYVRSIIMDGSDMFIGGKFKYYNTVPRRALARIRGTVQVEAISDSGSGPSTGGVAIANVLVNDTYNNNPASFSTVSLMQVYTGNPGVNLNPATGEVIINPGTPAGTYTVAYQICTFGTTCNCDSTGAYVTVIPQSPDLVAGIRADAPVTLSGLQSTQKIIIAGYFSTYNNINTHTIARLNNDLTLDTSFNSTGPGPNSTPLDFDIQPDNKIVIVGEFTNFSGGTTPRGVTRLDANGNLDPAFNGGGTGVAGETGKVYSAALQTNGKILIGGNYTTYNGTARKNIARLNADGSLDTSFNPGSGVNDPVWDIEVLTDGKILIVGGFSLYQGTSTYDIARLNSNGTLDTAFSSGTGAGNGTVSTGSIRLFTMQSDGRILIGGDFIDYNGVPRRNIARLNANGTLDTTFNPGTGFNGLVRSICIDANGKIFVGGEFTTFNGATVTSIVRLNSNGTLDTTFSAGTGPAGTVWTLTRQPDSKVIVGGSFTTYNGISAMNVTRISPATAGSQARISGYWETEPEIDTNPADNNFGKLSIYPNPSEGIFNIDLSGYDDVNFDITVHNTLGQVIYRGSISSQNTSQVDLTRFQAGNYFITLQNSYETINKVVTVK